MYFHAIDAEICSSASLIPSMEAVSSSSQIIRSHGKVLVGAMVKRIARECENAKERGNERGETQGGTQVLVSTHVS